MQKNGFPDRLKVLLKQKGFTQAYVANTVGTSVPSVNRWTRGGEIEYENLRSLADCLEVNWVWLRYGDEAISSMQDATPDSSTVTDMKREYLSQIIESEARMKSALEMAEVVNWEWNVLTGTLGTSDNAMEIFGQTPESLRTTLLPFSNLPLEALIKLFDTKGPYQWNFECKSQENNISRWFTARGNLVFDSLHRPVKVVAITAEITDRKQTEQALERSEYMMRKIIETIPVGLWAADENGRICLANPEVERIWGGAKYVGLKDYGEYKGQWEKTGKELTASDWTLARAVENGETSTAEVVNIEAFDGERRTIIMYATPLLDQDNKIIGAIEVNQDITDMKQAERSLLQSLNQWNAIFEQTLFGVVYIDHAQNILRINNSLSTLAKTNTNELVGKPAQSLFDKQTVQSIRHELTNLNGKKVHAFKCTGKLSTVSDDIMNLYFVHDNSSNKAVTTVCFVSLN